MIIQGDNIEVLKTLEANSVDSIVTDPPYGLSFMGKKWDYDVPGKEVWQECLRVLKPGGYLLSFAGTRTQHRMAVNIEDAGFEIRDMIAWVYGSGFPKSLNIGKAINKIDGVAFDEIPASGVGFMNAEGAGGYNVTKNQLIQSGESSERAKQWEGWGTALKPALEPITVARKPLAEKTVAENVLKWGTGGINIDGSRVETEDTLERIQGNNQDTSTPNAPNNGWVSEPQTQGRFPANLIHDGSDEVNDLLNDSARFFYCAKASKADRDEGLEGFEEKEQPHSTNMKCATCNLPVLSGTGNSCKCEVKVEVRNKVKNHHPTVKPTKLMQYLVKLVTPKGGVVLDPFMGSGSTGKACKLEGFDFIGIELDPEYCKIAEARII